MTDTLDRNAKTTTKFRANQGRLGGSFEDTPVVLVHHHGRQSGREYVTPVMYLPHDTSRDTFAHRPLVPRQRSCSVGDRSLRNRRRMEQER
jgi:hypothetical protein